MTHRTVLYRLLQYAGKYKVRMAGLVILGLVSILFEVARPFPVKIVIDHVLTDKPLPAGILSFTGYPAFLQDRYELLIACVLFMVFITVGGAILAYLSMSATINLAQQLVLDLSVDFFKKLQQQSLSFFNRHKTGDLIQRISGDVFVVYFLVAQIIIPLVTSLVALSLMFYILSRIDLTLALIALGVIPLLGIVLGLYIKPMNDSSMLQYKKLGDLSAFVQQSLSSMKIIQAFGRESFMDQKVKNFSQEYGRAFQRSTMVSTGFNQATLIVTGLATAGLIGLGAYRGIKGNFSAGDLYLFIGYIGGMLAPVTALFTAIGASVVIGTRGKRVFEIMDSNETVAEHADPAALTLPIASLTFEHVCFGYGDKADEKRRIVLDDINFSVEPGKIVAIVGATGAGKTSLISLLTRFYDPDEGRILINETDIRQYRLADLREQISIVLQDPFLFPMSVRDNIAFGNPAASDAEIEEAARAAYAHDFIMKLPEGYQTLLTEAAATLSGGEKQRIALARSFLKKAPIWILDEPTSSLDALTEANIFQSLSQQTSGRTVFIISHRLSTIRHADQIITLKDGQIAESGTHERLISSGTVYYELYKHHHIN